MLDSELNCPLRRFAAISAPDMQQVNLGMIGGGTVGSGVFHALQRNGDLMASRIGVKIRLAKSPSKPSTNRAPTLSPRT